jgi:hypothetical protein
MPDEMRTDSDDDGLSDAVERQLGTNVHRADSDGDGLSDGFEVAVGDHPRVRDLSIADPAGTAANVDDLVRSKEQLLGVTRHNADTDGDGFADWVESIRGGSSTTVADVMPGAVVPNPSPLDEFLARATSQIGMPYRFGAEADLDNPSGADAFDSSELVQWAAHQAGVELPDGSWKQFRSLSLAGHEVSVELAKATKGALLFGFSSDPMASPDRPERAFVAISLGNGKVLDVSERAGEVRELDAGTIFTHAATIPGIQPDAFEDTDGDGHRDLDEFLMGGDATRGMTMPWRDSSSLDSDGDGLPDVSDPTPNEPGSSNTPSSSLDPQAQDPAGLDQDALASDASSTTPYETVATYDDGNAAGLGQSFAAPADDEGTAVASYDETGAAYESEDVSGYDA